MAFDEETRRPGRGKIGFGTRSPDRADHWSGDQGAPAARAGFSRISLRAALVIELKKRGLTLPNRMEVIISYDGEEVSLHRLDLFVDDTIVVDLKTVKSLEDIHFAVIRSQLRAAGRQRG